MFEVHITRFRREDDRAIMTTCVSSCEDYEELMRELRLEHKPELITEIKVTRRA